MDINNYFVCITLKEWCKGKVYKLYLKTADKNTHNVNIRQLQLKALNFQLLEIKYLRRIINKYVCQTNWVRKFSEVYEYTIFMTFLFSYHLFKNNLNCASDICAKEQRVEISH